ncbi:F1-ATPase gamma subunit [Schizosaccharomyces cryophilus OY26]|uniref:ATP synthase subunit gamma n=1 Tax=Schizosaccharomyces cryophilus (strain OY26 / ATCC MYA-4695 / CBS 11777 / NBRC 106824 / NRRL Y48691) TaxID=653667 RepID=S9VTE2_SCHCR|nr:F1-ATPase gamma subunit [Schizosaccharomyces cryophilus OY26]EPY49399.1 F1-ATPase gamma subunit [Schizosaccharomyces cryophilus OY26]
MLRLTVKQSNALRPIVNLVGFRGFHASAPREATLKEIEQRLKSIRNIEKITKTIKTVAQTKLNRAQRAMDLAKKYQSVSNEFFKEAGTQAPKEGKTLLIACSSDKGLCGGIHSSISRLVRKELIDPNVEQNTSICVLGEKVRSQIHRYYPGSLYLTFAHIGGTSPSYEEALQISSNILENANEFDRIVIVYNRFASAVSFETVMKNLYTRQSIAESPNLFAYETKDEVHQPLMEFAFTNAIFAAMAEAHCSEMSSRRNAMENASKSAGEMINKFSTIYNRQRQASITNELIDIVTGANALG